MLMTKSEAKTHLRRFREELTKPKVSQETMARKVGVSLQWYRKLESGEQQNTSYSTAMAILKAFNAEQRSRELEVVSFDQLGLKIV